MPKTDFPTRRFSTAGATKEERDVMLGEFEHSDLSVREEMVAHFKGQSTNGLKEYLASWRANREAPEAPQRPLEAPVSEAPPTTAGAPDTDPGGEDAPDPGPSEEPDADASPEDPPADED